MKKMIAIVVALVLCLGTLSPYVFSADDTWYIAGTMNGWSNNNSDYKMTNNGDGTYTITLANLAAGSYEFKFTKNGSWDNCLGGAFMGSGLESSLSSPGSNITFTMTKADDVTIVLNPTSKKFTLTIGNQVAEEPENITIHVSVPEGWGTAYGYVWNPESLGAWPGTMVENGSVTLPAVFDGFIVNNGNGRQTADIKDIDLTKSEVWVTVHADNTYSLSYEAPGQDVEPEPVVSNIKIHVIAPESWENVYGYTYNPEQCGTWPGTLVENGVIVTIASFEGFIVNNGAGAQTGDIKDIDLTAEEVWVVVGEDCSYALFYNEADVVLPTPVNTIKINIIAEHWANVYAYTYNPANCGTWPGTLVQNGYVEVFANFEGLVINNGDGQQTDDIKDIDLTAEEVWVTVHADNTYSLSYEAPGQDVEPEPVVSNIKIHVIAPESWEYVYGYSYNPEQCGNWPGTLVENGVIVTIASFEGFIVNNGAGAQTADIKDIDLTAEEVWIVVGEDCSYALFYSEADVVLPTPVANIKINIIAEHWENVYAYTFNPASCGFWPGTLVANGVVEVPANFEGLVLNNGVDQQTADIKDIDLTAEEVWITVNADNSYTISYSAPVVDDNPAGGETPETGDAVLSCLMVLMMSVVGVVAVINKKNP